MSYLVRVSLADRPGTLGAVATALGQVGADILSLTVVDRGGGRAVDDLLVDLPTGVWPEVLLTAARQVPGTQVESVQPSGGRLDLLDDLGMLDRLAERTTDSEQRLADALPDLFRSDWALLIDPAGIRARSASAPTVGPTTCWLPLSGARLLDPGIWPERAAGPDPQAIAAPLGSRPAALAVGRRGVPRYRPSELARLQYVAAIAAAVPSLAAPADPTLAHGTLTYRPHGPDPDRRDTAETADMTTMTLPLTASTDYVVAAEAARVPGGPPQTRYDTLELHRREPTGRCHALGTGRAHVLCGIVVGRLQVLGHLPWSEVKDRLICLACQRRLADDPPSDPA